MKVSSLGKDDTLYLLDLYKSLKKVEEELDDYITNTALPEVSSIKKAQEIKQKSDEEASEILNSSLGDIDTSKMISLLEEYINSVSEIESSNEKSRQIMYVINELLDKKSDIENEIKALEQSEKVERKYSAIDKILPNNCRIINCDNNLKNNIISEYSRTNNVTLKSEKEDVTEELIKIVEEHISGKEKEEEEKLKIVNINNEEQDTKKVELPKEVSVNNEEILDKIAELQNEQKEDVTVEPKIEEPVMSEPVIIDNTPEETEEVVNLNPVSDVMEQSESINEEPVLVTDPLDRQLEELNQNINVEEPIQETIEESKEEMVTVKEPKEEISTIEENLEVPQVDNDTLRVVYISDDVQNKKIAKIPSHKKEKVFEMWKNSFEVPTIKPLEIKNNQIIENNTNNEGISFDSFVTGKTA